MPQFVNTTPLVNDHPKAHNIWHDVVSMYGADPTGVTNAATLIGNAITAAGVGGTVKFPAGSFNLTAGAGLTPLANQHWIGAGSRSTYLYFKNATAISATGISGFHMTGFNVQNYSGSTTGGGIKFDSTNQCVFEDVYVGLDQTASTDPGIWLKGSIGNQLRNCQVVHSGTHGIRLDNTGGTVAFNNENWLYNCTVQTTQGTTNAAIYSLGGGGNRFRDCGLETNQGYGIFIDQGNTDTIEGFWFEANGNHNINLAQSSTTQVVQNKLHYQSGTVGTAEHIHITASSAIRHHILIAGNHFQDGSTSGVAINIGSNVGFTKVIGNRGVSVDDVAAGHDITDSGLYTLIMGNDSGGTKGDTIKLGGASVIAPLGITETRSPSAWNTTFLSAFSAGNAALTNYFIIGTRGIPFTHTGDTSLITGSDELPIDSFAFYWDDAAGKIKARVRNHAGTYSTLDVTP